MNVPHSKAVIATHLLFACAAVAADANSNAPQALMPAEHAAVFKTYCYDCHDAASQEGGVNLEDISFDIGRDIPTAEQWQKVLNVINSGEMPPRESEQISDDAKTSFLDSLSNQIVVARRILSDSGGVITLRRLNRREYQNTIESLLGVRPDVSTLPDDRGASGFDTAGASLFVSGDQLEQYLTTARTALKLAFDAPKSPRPKVTRVEPEIEANRLYAEAAAEYRDTIARGIAWENSRGKPATDFGFIDAGQAKKAPRGARSFLPQYEDYLQRPESQTGAILISTIKRGLQRVKLPTVHERAGGQYVIRIRAGAYHNVADRYQYVEFSARSADSNSLKHLGWRRVTGTLDDPQIIEFPITHPAGKKTQYFVHQRTHQGRGDKNLWTIHREQNGIGTMPGVWVDWAELEGPIPNPPKSQTAERILPPRSNGLTESQYATDVIENFATEAFRGLQPTPAYVDKLVDHFAAERAKGLDVPNAMIAPLAIVLASPSFLYHVEASGDQSAELLDDRELAVRLAYFLWSDAPDKQLLSLAASGQLSKPDVLRQQTSRMLDDPRSKRFIRGFVHQWLEMERLDLFQYPATNFPTFDNATRESAREEIFATFETLIKDRLSLAALLNADFVVINDVLADYYDINGVEGHAFRKVSVPSSSPRGGLLGTAAVHAMGSDGTRSSPVERGAWVLRHLLHDAPPPAPANVPQLSRLAGEKLSARRLQRAHMEEPQCAQCHRKIDPIGYGLENFNAAGGWRDQESVGNGATGVRFRETFFEIDPSGTLPNGSRFDDYFGLRDAVGNHADHFARGFTEELIAYALGRPFGFTDQDLADEIIRTSKASGYDVNQFIHTLVQSKTFRSK